ncbi:MAG TPA: PEGA domain-containing protein [Exilispira sp.]|nr:PEGA domain-containing protein [Exilispira sp.]
MKKIYLFFFIFFLSILFLNIFSIKIFAYPTNELIYPEKIPKSEIKFKYNTLLDFKINYIVEIINKNNDNRANFIGSTISSFFDLYFNNRKIILDEKAKNQLVAFFFDELAKYFQNQRTINNQFNFKSSFLDDLYKKDFVLVKVDKNKDGEDNFLINYEISYEYDYKSSMITIYCKKNFLFSNEVYEKTFSFNYKYLSFYEDFKKVFINNIMSFFLNQQFYNLFIELDSSAYIEVDGTVVTHFVDEEYPSICELVLEKGEHNIKIFEDGYYPIEEKVKLEKDEKISISLNKKISHCKVKINTFPAGAKIKVANQYIGDSPLYLELPSGNHFIMVSMPGYESKEVFISVEDKDLEKEVYVYLMPINTTSFYIDYSNKILNQVYNYFWNGCYGLAAAVIGSVLYNYFIQFENSPLYPDQSIGVYSSISIITVGILTFAIFEILSLTELWKYYQFINYYTL